MQTFQERKTEILSRAKAIGACEPQYRRAYRATTDADLLSVVADNFVWCGFHGVVDVALLATFPADELTSAKIYLSGQHSAREGRVCLHGNASAELHGNASAELCGNASAELHGNASAELRGNASAELYDNASAKLRGNASAELYDNASAELRGNASAELCGNASAKLRDNASAELRGNASAELYDNASACAFGASTKASLFGYAICRFAPYWGATPTRIEVAKSAHEIIVFHAPQPATAPAEKP